MPLPGIRSSPKESAAAGRKRRSHTGANFEEITAGRLYHHALLCDCGDGAARSSRSAAFLEEPVILNEPAEARMPHLKAHPRLVGGCLPLRVALAVDSRITS